MRREAKADITPIRQRTQYTCMSASLSMALGAQGMAVDEDTVNKVMGAKPMKGASWEQALAAAQHFGMRGTLITPCPMSQLKEWTDAGVAVMIAWNPEGRDWSHASLVFDVDADGNVHVADPNIPDPEETVRIVPREEFLKKWFEKWPDYLVRRPALAIEREITMDGRQIKARNNNSLSPSRVAARFLEAGVKIRPFDRGDWMGYAGAEKLEDGSEPLIADVDLKEWNWRIRGNRYEFVTLIADANGAQAHFSNEAGDEEIAVNSTKTFRFQKDAMKYMKYLVAAMEAEERLPHGFRWV